jgi:hypothetical protein
MCILWYLRNIKVNPTFLGFLKPSGGVKMTPYEFLASLKSKWCGWGILSPPGFQFPVKELVASLSYQRWVA